MFITLFLRVNDPDWTGFCFNFNYKISPQFIIILTSHSSIFNHQIEKVILFISLIYVKLKCAIKKIKDKCMLNGVEKPRKIKKKLKEWGLTCEMKI